MELANVSAESLEEASADQEVEYDDYIAEFDTQLAAIYEDNDEDVSSIPSETTAKLKNDIDMAGREKTGAEDTKSFAPAEEGKSEPCQNRGHR